MNSTAIYLLAFRARSVRMFGAGWAWRGGRAERTEAKQQAGASAAQVQQVNQTRTTEHAYAQALATIGAKHEEDRIAAVAVPVAVAAGMRDGSLQPREGLATCKAARLSETVAGAVDHLRACQAVIELDRLQGGPSLSP